MEFRAFISVDINLPEIINFREELNKINADIKLVESENIHLTLKFLGNTKESQIDEIVKIMNESVSDITPFSLKFQDVGAFPNLNFMKVIWIGIENPEPLIKIAKKLDDKFISLGFQKEKRGFSPHITLGRVKSPKNKIQLKKCLDRNINRNFGEIFVDKISLKKSILSSKGPTYYIIESVKL